jgi:hypothetical protein
VVAARAAETDGSNIVAAVTVTMQKSRRMGARI